MTIAAQALISDLHKDPALRRAVLADPAQIHRRLYAPFIPPGQDDYAGVYRGTPGTSLEHRRMGGPSVLAPEMMLEFMPAKAVPEAMARLTALVGQLMAEARNSWDQISALAYLFCQFGYIHPFLDGNGHVQRALFAAAALEMGIPLSKRFALHPRAHDFLLAVVLETYSRGPDAVRPRWVSGAAEYLVQWLGGPFEAPGAGLPPED